MSELFMEDSRIISIHFDSVIDLLDYKSDGQNGDEMRGLLKGSIMGSHSKYGDSNKTKEDVVQHALLGDASVLRTLNEHIVKLNEKVGGAVTSYSQKLEVAKRKKIKGSHGDEIDIHNVYQGNLDKAWTRTKRIEASSKLHLATLFIEIGDNWSVDYKESLWRAAVAARLVRELENSGKSVKVIVGACTSNTYINCSKETTLSITVKEYGSKLSMERLAAMTHLGFFRVFGFAAFSAQDKYEVSSGLGSSKQLERHNIPLQFKSQVESGSTKMVFIRRSNSISDAIDNLTQAYSQMKEFAKAG